MAYQPGTWLPDIVTAVQQAPKDAVNPFLYYAEQLSLSVFSGIAEWSKPVFLVVGAVALINAAVTAFTLWVRYRREGGLPVYKMLAHRDGGRYIVLNSNNVFLVFHLLTSLAFTTWCVLHVFQYARNGDETAWMEMTWSTLVWLAPYMGLLLACLGCLYGILATPYSHATHINDEGVISHTSAPLASVPSWILNTVVVALPLLLVATIVAPGLLLILAIRDTQDVSLQLIATLKQWAPIYADGTAPSQAEQIAGLSQLGTLSQLGELTATRWRPVFVVWAVWVGLASALAMAATVTVYRVTKARYRLMAIQSESTLVGTASGQSGGLQGSTEASEVYTGSNVTNRSSLEKLTTRRGSLHSSSHLGNNGMGGREGGKQMERARWEHLNLTIQFAAAAVLLLLAEVAMLFNCILGYRVHMQINLFAVSILLPMISYVGWASVGLVLIMLRAVQGKTEPTAPPTTPKTSQSARFSTDATFMSEKKQRGVSFDAPSRPARAISKMNAGIVSLANGKSRNEGALYKPPTKEIYVTTVTRTAVEADAADEMPKPEIIVDAATAEIPVSFLDFRYTPAIETDNKSQYGQAL